MWALTCKKEKKKNDMINFVLNFLFLVIEWVILGLLSKINAKKILVWDSKCSVYTDKINRVFNVDSLGLLEVNFYRFKISAFVLDFYTFFYIGIIFCRLFEYAIFI